MSNTEEYTSLSDRELLIVVAERVGTLTSVISAHVPQDCITHRGLITSLADDMIELKAAMQTKASKGELQEVKDSQVWAYRLAIGAALTAAIQIAIKFLAPN